MTPRLVALDLPGGPAFVAGLQHIWDHGDAVFPVDQRLPAPAKAVLLDAMGVGEPVEQGDALVVATSGSTGTPRGVVLTHDAVAASAWATSRRLGVTGDDHWLACLPLAHVGGLAVVTRALVVGTRLTILPGFEPDAVMASGASLVSLVATALRRIDAAAFRAIVLGGAAPPADLPPNVVTTYGMTETRQRRGLRRAAARRRRRAHRRRRRDPAARTDAAALLPRRVRPVRGRLVPDRRPRTLADDGRLHVDGRAGDLIITGGENVWPEPVEAALRHHPDVADVAVTGVPDDEWGQILVAVVVPSPGTVPTLDVLRATVKEQLPAYCAPRRLVLTESIPRTALGKIRRGRPPSAPGTFKMTRNRGESHSCNPSRT